MKKFLATGETGIPRIMETVHVTLDESKFLGAQSLVNYMDEVSVSDSYFSSDATSKDGSVDSGEPDIDVSIDEFVDVNEPDVTDDQSHDERELGNDENEPPNGRQHRLTPKLLPDTRA